MADKENIPVNETMSVNTVSMQFSDSKIPEFKKVASKAYILFGEENDYPDYLLYLYNKSAKHNAIINGKLNYGFGGGIKADNEDAAAQWLKSFNRQETAEEVIKKSLLDIEIFGGFAWQIIFNQVGKVQEIYHLEFGRIRTNEDRSTFFHKKDWKDAREKAQEFPAFDPKVPKTSIFYFTEYRPGCKVYPLPGYVGSNNWIESDIEVSKHTLTNAKTGFTPSKFINFYNGEPEEGKKKEITRRFENRNTGSEGKKIIIAFNNDPTKRPTIDDLGTSDLTKEDFQAVDNLISSNIYAGHSITTPELFGIQVPGKLGNTNELRIGYEIFKNTYVKNKQHQIECVLNEFAAIKGIQAKFSFIETDPVGLDISDAVLLQAAPRSWLLEKLGIDINKYTDAPTQIQKPNEAAPAPQAEQQAAVNENLKNLTGRQQQQLDRILRKYDNGVLSRERATTLLRESLGLSDEAINSLLGTATEEGFSREFTEEEVADMFSEVGEAVSDYKFIKSKEVDFSSDDDCLRFELDFFENKIQFDETVEKKPSLIERITKKIPKVLLRYSYEPRAGLAPIIATTRPFCRKLITLDRLYSRKDIESISMRLGYSVWDRRGGFWGDKPSCRHIWKMHVVIKK
jgi:hypothetical protein